MDQRTLIILVVVAILIVALAAWALSRQRRSQTLREDFGPEYGRAVEEFGNRGRAESELEARRKRVNRLPIRSLTQTEYKQFAAEWTEVQARFVDDPNGSIRDADDLIQHLMHTRGYPVGDFEQRAADISVDHPHVVEHYRTAHGALQSWGSRDADTEQLRQALVHYRALFDELLERPAGATSAA